MSTDALSQLAYQQIRQMFLDHRFSAGMKISENQLAKELGISRTPVREAIRQLQTEGLLYQIPHSGTYISRPGRREIAEIYEVRQALEVLAIEKATSRLTHEQLEQLSQQYREMHEAVVTFLDSDAATMTGEPLRQFLRADLSFHLTILESADNRTAIKIYCDVQMRQRSFGDQSHRRDREHLSGVLKAHAAILRALQQRDGEAARQHLVEHIQSSLRDALFAFDEMPTLDNHAKR